MNKTPKIIHAFTPEVGKYYIFSQNTLLYFTGEILKVEDGVVKVRIVRSERDHEMIGDKGVSNCFLVISGKMAHLNLDKKRIVYIPVKKLHYVED